jgi:hypothetical protein
MTVLDVSLTELPNGSIMRQDTPWAAIGMSRASWYRHGKPATKPAKPETRAEMARRIHVSQRTLYRVFKQVNEERVAKVREYRDAWLRKMLKKHLGKSDQEISDLWKAHIDSMSEEQFTARVEMSTVRYSS